MTSIVVVGASLAGLRAAEELRRAGFDGTLTVVGDEPHRPYDRPPLSKQVLAGEWDVDRIPLTVAGDDGLDGLAIDWREGIRAMRLDVAARRVALEDGSELVYDGLVIATGAKPRTLPRGGLAGIHTLRTLDDCLEIRAALDATPRRVVVVGAGFIGAEVAATCRERGLDVTLVEALDVPLERAIGRSIGALTAEIHCDHGVDVRLGVGVDRFEGKGRVERVHLVDGSEIDADVVVVGVGVVPNTGWLDGSGLRIDDGVVCDATCLAAPGVVAAGDVARWPSPRFGRALRVEHWDNAISMGEHAARRLLGETGVYDPVPWFWSDQYDRKIQLAGRSGPDDLVRVIHGSVDDRRFVALFGRGGRVVGVLGVNRPRHVMQWRARILAGITWEDGLAVAAEDEAA